MNARRADEGVALATVIRALANEDRLRIVSEIAAALASGAVEGLTIAESAARVEISRFSASRHLGILREAGVVRRRQVGVRSLHSLDPVAFELVEDWLYPLVDALDARRAADVA